MKGTPPCRKLALLNEVLMSRSAAWAVYGDFSVFHVFTNPKRRSITPTTFDPRGVHFQELRANVPDSVRKLRMALILNGVDFNGWPGGTISAVHSDADLDDTVRAFDEAVGMLQAEEAL